MWSRHWSQSAEASGIIVTAVNPGSLLATKMVQEGFGVAGADIDIGATILTQAAIADEFGAPTGRYFDNDSGRFADPHPDVLDHQRSAQVVTTMQQIVDHLTLQ